MIAAPSRLPLYVAAGRAVLLAEVLAVGLWPAAALCATVLAAILLGLPSVLPWAVHLAMLLAALAVLAWLLGRAAQQIRVPRPSDGERRLERDSGLTHRPFSTLRDRPAAAPSADIDPIQGILWRSHQQRAQAALASLSLAPPRPGLPRHDPYALRAAAAVALVAGLIVAGPRAGARLQAGLLPGLPGLTAGAQAVVQAWIQPPAYTGLPPVFLPPGGNPAAAPVTVPSGSRLTLSITGAAAKPTLTLAGRPLGVEALGHDSFQATALVSQGGRLRLGGRFSALAAR